MAGSKMKVVEQLIRDKSEIQLKGLITELFKSFPDMYEHILLWDKGCGGVGINEKLALEYWAKAESIIGEFNNYGGGPDEDEYESYSYIEKLCELIPELSWQTRQKIMDGMLVQYHYSNSGFDDALTDACFEMCKERNEWLYLAEKLLSFGGNWDNRLVMNIYKIIGDNEAFLKLRRNSLEYGSDYFELVQYYTKRKDTQTALSYAHKGLEKGNGRVDHLASYLFDYYENKSDTQELEKIMQTCEKIKKERDFVSDRLYAYYKVQNDYENAKKYLLKKFDYIDNRNLDKEYKKIAEYLTPTDWDTLQDKLFHALKDRDIESYMRICLEKGLKQEVYDIISKKCSPWNNDYDYFADKLKKDFPEKIIEYYFKLAVHHVENGSTRKSYAHSMKYFKKAKAIYQKVLKDNARWERKLSEIRVLYKKRRAFLEESRVLD